MSGVCDRFVGKVAVCVGEGGQVDRIGGRVWSRVGSCVVNDLETGQGVKRVCGQS